MMTIMIKPYELTSEGRKYLFEKSFFHFVVYYFNDSIGFPFAQFHLDYIQDLQAGKNIVFNGFRESWKTVLIKYYIIRCIVTKRYHYICFICDESNKAQKRVADIAKQLQENQKLIADYGTLWKSEESGEKKATRLKRIWDFETTTDIKVEALGTGEVFKWRVHNAIWLWEIRPQLIVFDDIDTERSCNTENLIDKNYQFVKTDVFGGMSDNGQFVFLYNTLFEDWVGPRLRKEFEGKERTKVYNIPIIDPSMDEKTITRPARYTLEQILYKKETQWDIAFAQNFLLIPYLWWQAIIKKAWIRCSEWLDEYDRVMIGVDPSISQKTHSDPYAIVMTGKKWDDWYVLRAIELVWEAKENADQIIKQLYFDFNCQIVNVETVAFQKIVETNLRDQWIATQAINTNKDKVSRLMEKEILFKSGKIHFLPWTERLQEQLVVFPNGSHDDLVDAFLFSIYEESTVFLMG